MGSRTSEPGADPRPKAILAGPHAISCPRPHLNQVVSKPLASRSFALQPAMAPPNGSAKARKATSGKQAPKPVMPALPLPYVKRKAAADAAAGAAVASGGIAGKPAVPKSSDAVLTTLKKYEANGSIQSEARRSTETSPFSTRTPRTDSSVAKESTAGANSKRESCLLAWRPVMNTDKKLTYASQSLNLASRSQTDRQRLPPPNTVKPRQKLLSVRQHPGVNQHLRH